MDEDRKKRIATRFLDQVFYIFELRDMFELLSDEANGWLLRKVAERYFERTTYLVKLGFLLEIAKITDPKKQFKRDNMSLEFINDEVLGQHDAEASRLVDEMLAFRERIELARHRILSHNDLETYEENLSHGSFLEEELDIFLGRLHEFSNIVSAKFLGGTLSKIDTSEQRDDVDLLMWLQRGLAFQELMETETDQVKINGFLGILKRVQEEKDGL